MPRIIPRTICNSTTNWIKANYCNDASRVDIDDLAVDISEWTDDPTLLTWDMLKIDDNNVPNGLIYFHQSNVKHKRILFPKTEQNIVDLSGFVFNCDNNRDKTMPEWQGWAIFRWVKCNKMINIKLDQSDNVDNFSNSMWHYYESDIKNWCPYIHFANGFNKIKCSSRRATYIILDNSTTDLGNLTREIHNLDLIEVPDNFTFTGLRNVSVLDVKNVHCKVNLSESVMERDAIVDFFTNALMKVSSVRTCTLGSTLLAKLTEEDKKIATDKGWTLA